MAKKRNASEPGSRDLSAREGARQQRASAAVSSNAPVGPARPSRALIAALSSVLCLAVLAVYAQVYRNGFVEYDDSCYVFKNSAVKNGLSLSNVAWAFTTFSCANYHPLTWLSHMMDYQLFGLNPGAQHLVNVGFHLASTVLLFLAFVRMTRRPWRSAVVAGIFAIHPIHVESVAWVAERKDVLSTFFAMLTLLLYARYAENPRTWKYVLVVLVFALGLLAKPMLVTLPFVLVLVDMWPLGRLTWPPSWGTLKSLLVEKIPLFVMVAAASVVTFVAQHVGGAVSDLGRLPFSARFGNAATAYITYIWKALWPMKLAVLYPYDNYSGPKVVGALAILAIATIGAFVLAKARPYVLAGWLWYLGMLVPVIGLVQVGAQSIADRYTYLPLVGLSFAIVWVVGDLVEGRRQLELGAGVTAFVALLLFGVQGYRQAGYWKSSDTLFEHSIAVTVKNCLMYKSLGVALDHEGKTDEAIACYEKALAIRPDLADAHNGLGLILDRQGKYDEAAVHYRQALASEGDFAEAHNNLGAVLDRKGRRDEAKAEYEKALAIRPDFADVHQNLGALLAREGKRDEAMSHYRQVLAVEPSYPEAHNNLGVLLADIGKHDEAISHYRAALASKPDYAEAHANLGHELMQAGKFEEAISHIVRAVELDPKSAEAQADLGTLLAAQRRFDEAKTHLEESLRVSPDQPAVHSNLGYVLLALGRPDEAIAHCREALRLKPDAVDAHYNLGMALAAQQKKADAVAEFSEVLKLNPAHVEARRALEQLQGSR